MSVRPDKAVTVVPPGEHTMIVETVFAADDPIERSTEITVERSATLDFLFIYGDSRDIDKRITITLMDDCEVHVRGLFFGSGTRKYALSVTTVHRGKRTNAFTKVRGVLTDASAANVTGMIRIEKTGNQTDAYLEEHVLLLGDKAHSTAEPNLEIEAPDVKASHAATTGRIDDEQLFYLMSRGLQPGQAKRMIVEGFFHDILDTFPVPKAREQFLEGVARRIEIL